MMREKERMRKLRRFERMKKSGNGEKKRGREVFLERKERGVMKNMKSEGDEENEEKEKKQLATVGENEKVGRHLMAKLRVV